MRIPVSVIAVAEHERGMGSKNRIMDERWGHANNYEVNIESMHKDYCSHANDWAVLCPDRRGD